MELTEGPQTDTILVARSAATTAGDEPTTTHSSKRLT
tara:strand:+ start:1412 stop:1522 length:111 start_codon:yes stop_codon:yes gene_type:complete